MKLKVLTCAVFASEEEARNKLWIFLRSCEKFKIEPVLFGSGRIFPGYRVMGCEWLLEALKVMPSDVTHVLFSDSWDAFFLSDLDEILDKYRRIGSPPILVSAYIGLGNESDMSKYKGCFDESIPYRYPNRGGWIAEVPAMIDALEKMVATGDQTGDECFLWYRGWREGWFRPTLDSHCEIFQVSTENMEMMPKVIIDINRGRTLRVQNRVTGSFPSILHLSGGYSDPQTGKDERMKPFAKALEIL